MQFYRRQWFLLLEFAKERRENYYSEALGMDFLEKTHDIFGIDPTQALRQSEVQQLRVIRMIGDFQLHQTILRRYYKHKEILTEPYFLSLSTRFEKHLEDRACSKVTIDHYIKQSQRFMDYLVSRKILTCEAISLPEIHSYIRTLSGYTYKTVEQIICSMRAFFRFLLEIEEVQVDFAAKMPMVQARKQTRIPSVWTQDELKKLLAVIDRGNPKGKRDYAILLLACRLGIRCTDIKLLKIENFHWENKTLVFTQSKTKSTLCLPLTPEVGWAVIDYLKHGRPKIDSPILFVRHMAPFVPFSEGDHLNQLIKGYMQQAHLPALKKRRGMHSLRHTMASMLLEKDTPLSTISDILGHSDTDSTAVYLKVELRKLKECALDFQGDDHE